MTGNGFVSRHVEPTTSQRLIAFARRGRRNTCEMLLKIDKVGGPLSMFFHLVTQ